jgi:hypothetical protein
MFCVVCSDFKYNTLLTAYEVYNRLLDRDLLQAERTY